MTSSTMATVVLWAVYGIIVLPTTAVSQSDVILTSPTAPRSTEPQPCPAGLQWSSTTNQCCPVCAPGTGATGSCRVSNSSNSSLDTSAEKCEKCVKGVTYSTNQTHTDHPCLTCTPCPKHARVVHPCNSTHNTVCECEIGLFYLAASGQCELCERCPVGSGAAKACGGYSDTVCRPCLNGTYSDVVSGLATCRPCRLCEEGEEMLQECSPTKDTLCITKYMDIPPMYRFNGKTAGSRHHDLDLSQSHHVSDDADRRHNAPLTDDDKKGIDVIPLYCAALGSVVVGLLAYVIFVHYRRMRDKRMSREPHEDVEYSKACAGPESGIFLESEHHHHHHHQQHHQQRKCQSAVITEYTRIRDLPQTKRKDLEKSFMAGSRAPTDWKILARELGYNNTKIASFESRGGNSRDPGAIFRQVLQDWSYHDGATVAVLLRALRNIGRHDVMKYLQAECAEQLQPLTVTLPHHNV